MTSLVALVLAHVKTIAHDLALVEAKTVTDDMVAVLAIVLDLTGMQLNLPGAFSANV